MSITAINQQLLRAIGVGIAVVRGDDFQFLFSNGPFADHMFDFAELNARLGTTGLLEAGRRYETYGIK